MGLVSQHKSVHLKSGSELIISDEGTLFVRSGDGSVPLLTEAETVIAEVVDTLYSAQTQLSYLEKRTSKVAVICGVAAYEEEIKEVSTFLTQEGYITLVAELRSSYGGSVTLEDDCVELDLLTLQKIDMADAVFIVNEGEVFEGNAKSVIEYAENTGKPVYCCSPS